MKYKLLIAVLIGFFAPAVTVAQSETTVSVQMLLEQVDQALRSVAESNDIEVLPPFASARLRLNTVVEEQGGFQVLKIFNFSNQQTEQFVQGMTLELTPPDVGDRSPTDFYPRALAQPKLGDALASAIIAAAAAVKNTPLANSPDLTNLTASVRFAVTGTDAQGIEIVVLEIGRNTMQQNVQEIVVEFNADVSH